MKFVATVVHVCLALSLAACGGGGHLSVENPGGGTLSLDFPPGQAVEHRLPTISGGIPPYEAGIEGCPVWVTLPGQEILAGTAPVTESGRSFFCTYSVTESDPGFRPARTVSYALRLVVGPAVASDLMLSPTSKQSLSVGTFYNEELPAASGGVAPYTYSLTCAGGSLPPGMSFAAATRRFAGTPTARFRDSCTYSVTDSAAVAATVSQAVEIEVAGPVTGTLMLPPSVVPGNKVSLSVGSYDDVPFEPATGGVEPYTYSLTCAGGSLPSGMSFAAATRRLAGTPGARFQDSCIYSVTDSAAVAATVSQAVEIEVAGPVTGTLMLPPSVVPGNKVSLSVGSYDDVPFEPATGGVEPYTYSLTCAGGSLPSGMSFAAATRRLAGTPGARFQDSCIYSVTDSSQPAATVSERVEIEVAGPVTGTLMLPASVVPGNVIRLRVGERARITFQPATGGVEPYTYGLNCPDPSPIGPNTPSMLPRPGLPPYEGLGFGPLTRVLSGTPGAAYSGPDCTYWVTDSATPAATLARSIALIIEPGRVKWRFPANDRSLLQVDKELNRNNDADPQMFEPLPEALPESGTSEGTPVYRLLDDQGGLLHNNSRPLGFNPKPDMHRLEYVHGASDPPLGRTSTYRYQVLFGDTVDDTLCIDVSYRDEDEEDDDDQLIASIRIHDNAYWDGTEYRCPPVPLQPASASHAAPSNPVHEALGPVHARRAADVAHATVRDRVRGWTPGAPRVLTAIAPKVGIGSLSGESDGFDYTGSSESLSVGAELGASLWQAGLIASVTRTDLHYRASAGLSERGYHAGEHNTEIFSLHPFAAWHMPSGGNVWASLGAGTGKLSHRDDLGFLSWSRSDVRLRAYAAGASVPVAEVLAGELEAEAGIESFAFEIEGGDRISSALPTMRGRDYRAGLAWSAPIAGGPSLSVAYKHLTGDGPEGGQLKAKGSISVEGIFDPRLTVTGNAGGSFGLGDYDHDSWGLGGGVRFASGAGGRGFALNLDTRLVSLDDGGSSDVGIRGEAGYGLWGGPYFGAVRPYVGLVRHSSDGSLRRALGVDLRNTPASRVNVEVHDQPRGRFRALRFTLRHRF